MPKSTARSVHRPLHLSTPLAKGPDVRALQEAVKEGLAHYAIDWLPLKVDGELGRQTIHTATFYAWVIGLGNGHRRPLKRGVLSVATQHLLRNPRDRSAVDRARERKRKTRLQKIRKAQTEGPKATCAYAKEWIGTTENPAGTNSGPTSTRNGKQGGVSFWEAAWGLGACFWCLCFASFCAKFIGGARIAGNCVFAAEIERMAEAHENGWVKVSAAEAREGDIALFCFDGTGVPDHGELVVGPFKDGLTDDVGGNTSSESSGSQSNGGGVFPKQHPLSQLTCVARPLYS